MKDEVCGIILAGGTSARLGKDKAFLDVGGKPIIVRVMDVLLGLCGEIIISTNDVERYSDLPVRVVPDVAYGAGALVGLYSSLGAMSADYAFVTACDMPFLSGAFIQHMMERPRDYDALVPVEKGYAEPLHAIYSRQCLGAIEKHIQMGHKQFRSFYDDVNVKYIGEETVRRYSRNGVIFFNVNTPDDLDEARMIYSSQLVTQG